MSDLEREEEMERQQEEQMVRADATPYDESQIQVLEGLEAVRKRPGMYIGSTGPKGLHHLVYEIVDNSIDEALAGYCTHIDVDMLPGDIISVTDNGRGIPVGIHEKMGIPTVTVVLTVLHAGGKFGGSGYKVSGGLHGVGSSVVNALSEWMEVEISRDGNVYAQRFERGVAVNDLTVIGPSEHDGTTIRFKADDQIFTETTEYDFEVLQKRLREQAFLNAGLCIRLHDRRNPDNVVEQEYCYEGGISSFVDFMNKTRGYQVLHPEVIHISINDGDSIAEVALQYNDSYNENIVSFANNIHTVDGGTHENSFKTGITRILNDYARRHGLLKENDSNLKGDDVREGLTAVISVKLKDAQFEGQTKAKLGNTAVGSLITTLLNEKLAPYLEENPAVGKGILEKSINAARVREAAQRAREMARKKSGLSSTRMPEKLADCIWSDMERTELYIVEGDSAGGSAIQGRDRNYQAILPLWGKMLNVEKARLDKVYGKGNWRVMSADIPLDAPLYGRDGKVKYNPFGRIQDLRKRYWNFDDPEFNAFAVKVLRNLVRHLTEKGWIGQFQFIYRDEPDPVMFANGRHVYKHLQKIAPELVYMNTLTHTGLIEGYPDVDIVVPAWTANEGMDAAIRNATTAGRRAIVYNNFSSYLDRSLLCTRTMGAILYNLGCEGFNQWSWAWSWDKRSNPYQDAFVDGYGPGEGYLVYFDPYTTEITSSMRWEQLRETAEDFDAFKLYEKLGGDPRRYTGRLGRDMVNFETDPQRFMEVRREFLADLEKLAAGRKN